MDLERFAVALETDGVVPQGTDKRVVFHGVNKSGSLAMARVMQDAYYFDGRAHQFFSQYMGVPRHYEDVIQIINHAARGHAFFVGHQLFDAFRRNDGHVLITQLRHPVPRVVSVYQWLKNKHEQAAGREHDPTSPYDAAEGFPTLEEFVIRGKGLSHSQMTQFGIGFGPRAGKIARTLTAGETYERAMEALIERVDWFGIAELLEESLYTYAAICGLPSVRAWGRDDRNTGRQMVWELPESTKALIEEIYECELRFYLEARSVFRDRLSKIKLGGDIAAYRVACEAQYKDRLL